jgi:nicotinate-nucleotide adenylyltransferase
MCELAMRDLRRVEVSAIEAQLPRPSLTLRLLEHLQQSHPDAQLRLVIGSDLLPETASWHRIERVRELAPLLVVPRAMNLPAQRDAPALPAISSTDVRACLRTSTSTEGLLSPVVAQYAQAHALYR